MSNNQSTPRMIQPSAFVYPHALVEGEVFTILKQDTTSDKTWFPDIPDQLMPPFNSAILPTFGLNWIPNEHPFMLLIPRHPPFYGPLFDRLGYSHRSIPVTRIRRNCYGLSDSLKMEWVSLERNLRAIASAMIEICSVPLPEFFNFWAFPKRYGYELYYSSQEAVRIVATRARDAFIPLMAAITFLLMVLDKRESVVPGFTWRDRVLKKTNIHHHWLTMLEDSVVADLQIARVGGIIDMQRCQYQGLIPLFATARLDLYLCWGNIRDAPMRPPQFLQANQVPDHHIIKILHNISRNPPPSSVDEPSTTPTRDTTERTVMFPPVDQISKQKQGESWQMFFARREEDNLRRLERETPKQRQSRLSKEEFASKHQMPGHRGPTVFKWEDVDGFRIRRPVVRNMVEDIWTDYSFAQRRYDGFRNEWDICTKFGDPDSGDSDEESLRDFWMNGPRQGSPTINFADAGNSSVNDVPSQLLPDDPKEPDHQEGNYSSSADLNRVHSHEEDTSQLNNSVGGNQLCIPVITEAFEHTAYYRFGFSQSSSAQPSSYSVSWDLASKILGDGRWRVPSSKIPFPPQNVQNNIRAFLGHISSGANIDSIPRNILDVHKSDSVLWRAPRRVRVWLQKSGDSWYYFIRPWNYVERESAPMELGLTSPMGLLEIIRRRLGPDLDLIAEFLVNRGIAFNTFIRDRTFPISQMDSRSHTIPRLYQGLGFRPVDYKPDAIDYKAYVSTRNRFLRTSRCRAALLKGGLVTRIAKDVVPYDEVFYGPSTAVFYEGFCLPDERDPSQGYWDDHLNDDELDKICGVYKVATGQNENGVPQTSDLSWWPKPSIWEGSGLHIGYWSEDCERWYQNHLSKCLDGTAVLRNPADWRHALRFSKDASKMIKKGESLAAGSLARVETTNMTDTIHDILQTLHPF